MRQVRLGSLEVGIGFVLRKQYVPVSKNLSKFANSASFQEPTLHLQPVTRDYPQLAQFCRTTSKHQ